MESNFYAIKNEFNQIITDKDVIDIVLVLPTDQIDYMLYSFDAEKIFQRAISFFGDVEKNDNELIYHHELFHTTSKIQISDYSIKLFDKDTNVFIGLLNRMYKNILYIDQL